MKCFCMPDYDDMPYGEPGRPKELFRIWQGIILRIEWVRRPARFLPSIHRVQWTAKSNRILSIKNQSTFGKNIIISWRVGFSLKREATVLLHKRDINTGNHEYWRYYPDADYSLRAVWKRRSKTEAPFIWKIAKNIPREVPFRRKIVVYAQAAEGKTRVGVLL